jgi:hypothetical protein
VSLSGNGAAGLNGTLYAPTAQVTVSGNASLNAALVVDRLIASGNVNLSQTADGTGGTGDTSGIAGTLLAGNLTVYVNDPSGYFTSDELARISDAINTWDNLLAPYSVTIAEVSDPILANVVLDESSTSASGSAANGVLGCFNTATSEITLLQGWNWYGGADPTQIGAGQYDFETTVLHELGHALGLGHSTDAGSPMHGTLAAGVADRTPTMHDLNIPDPPSGADPLSAARPKISRPPSTAILASPLSALAAVDIALASLDARSDGTPSWIKPTTDLQPGSRLLVRMTRTKERMSPASSAIEPAAVDGLLT